MSKNLPQIQTSTRKPNLMLVGLRLNRGLSQRQLAYFTGVSTETIRLIEKGHVPGPRVGFDLAEFLGVNYTDLWPLESDRSRTPA